MSLKELTVLFRTREGSKEYVVWAHLAAEAGVELEVALTLRGEQSL
jgi:hypothetical protein